MSPGLAGFQHADRARLEPLLVDGESVGSQGQIGAAAADDEQLVVVGTAIAQSENDVAGRHLPRSFDVEVAFDHRHRGGSIAVRRSRAGERRDGERDDDRAAQDGDAALGARRGRRIHPGVNRTFRQSA